MSSAGSRPQRPSVLILIGAMWPGNDSSGPNRSVRGLCEALADSFDFSIMARSNAPGLAGDPAPLEAWIEYGHARTRYFSVGPMGARGLVAAVRQASPDVLLMNSVWDREFTLPVLAARRGRVLARTPAVLSTRGEFSDQALALKPLRKRAMRGVLAASGALDGVTLHATSELERADVARAFPNRSVFVAANIRPVPAALPRRNRPDDRLRACFVGRISPVKGLDFALAALAQVTKPVAFRIFGPIEDADYHTRCREAASQLPGHVAVTWEGPVEADAIPAILRAQDLLLMPSHSENFGHAIFEALAAGVPVAVGPNTPWRNLAERGAGQVLALGDAAAWAAAIDTVAAWTPAQRERGAAAARSVAEDYVASSVAADQWHDFLGRLTRGGGEA